MQVPAKMPCPRKCRTVWRHWATRIPGTGLTLLARVLDAGDRINLSGGSARNWAADIKEVKAAMRSIRDMAGELNGLPRLERA